MLAQENSYDFCTKASLLPSIRVLFFIVGWGALLVSFQKFIKLLRKLSFIYRNIQGMKQHEFENLAVFQNLQEQGQADVKMKDYSPYDFNT